MIASFPMYDPIWLNQANDQLWAALAARLRARGIQDVPACLHRNSELGPIWTAPSLLLAQTCGYPLVTGLGAIVRLVATPHYDAEGCDGPHHRAAIVVRKDDPARSLLDLRGRIAGINGHDSNTGMNLFRAAVADIATEQPFFASVISTGSHARSFAALISGKIDVASIDAVTLALLRDRYPDRTARLRVLEWTASSPSLPLITRADTSDCVMAALRDALAAVADDPALEDTLRVLRIRRFTVEPITAYEPILSLQQYAIDRGYPELR